MSRSQDAFQALLSSSHVISHAVLPLANSSNGPVAATQDFLQKHGKELVQLDSLSLEIQHALMRTAPAPGQSLPELQVITSHEQVHHLFLFICFCSSGLCMSARVHRH